MELTRRDALAALAAMGASTGCLGTGGDSVPSSTVPDMLAVAEVVYPDEVETSEEFIETYVIGRAGLREEYLGSVSDTLGDLEDSTREIRGDGFGSFPVDERDALLRTFGVDTADPRPEGTLAERVRYYVVNELQYALYTTPVGGRLVGIENPIGHPGGTDTYTKRSPEP